MKKPKNIKTQESYKSKGEEKSKLNENDKKKIFQRATFKKEDYKKLINTRANTAVSDFSKEAKKDITIKKKISKDAAKNKKQTISAYIKEKEKDKDKKEVEISNSLNQKKQKIKKKEKNKTNSKKKRMINSFSQKNFGKLKFNLNDNRNSNNAHLSNNNSSRNILLGADNFIKNLLSKYQDGTDSIINEDEEPLNNILNNDDYETFNCLEEKTLDNNDNENNNSNNINTESNLSKKKVMFKEEQKINTINNNKVVYKNKPKIIAKKSMKLNNDNSNYNQIKSSIYSSFVNSPSRMQEKKTYMNSQTRFQTINKKTIINSPKKRNSLTKPKKKEKEKDKTNQENKDSKIKRQLLYSKKIINGLTNIRHNQNNDLELRKNETIQASSNNLDLDIIFENNITEPTSHRYLQNTVSTKNKMVPKKTNNNAEQSKNACYNAFIKTNNTILHDSEKNTTKKAILSLNRTPKAQKIFKERFIHTDIDNNIATRNRARKSFYFHRELSIDSTMTKLSTTMSTPSLFNGKIDDYLITKELGKGSYAIVKLAVHKVTKNKYAIKIYSKQSLIDPQKRNVVKNEINILKQIDHENVMKLYEVIDTPSNLYLVLEYINGVNLLEILKKEKDHYIKEQRAKKLFLQVVNGISYCHNKNIFHRDIKLENILVLKDDTIKIIDFGFGVKCNKDVYQKILCGTPSYMPPEILNKEKYIPCYSDIWSLGVLFYTMLYGIFPFRGKDENELIENINEKNIAFPEYNQIEDKTKELFQKIFVLNPNTRISLDEIISILS